MILQYQGAFVKLIYHDFDSETQRLETYLNKDTIYTLIVAFKKSFKTTKRSSLVN